MPTKNVAIDDLKSHLAQRLSEHRLTSTAGAKGTLKVALTKGVTRTFRAHWTGFKLLYPGKTLTLRVELNDGSFYAEGYISLEQASYVLAFRKTPHSVRGTGAERPDDKFASKQAIEIALGNRRAQIDAGLVPDEEIIRYEDLDDPIEAIDAFFNYTNFYCFRSTGNDWSEIGYTIDASVGWDEGATAIASLPIDAAVDEGLKRSDILWVAPNTAPDRPIPCWFLYTKDKRLFILSGETQQTLPDVHRIRDVRVSTRWKGRDALMSEFDASVRLITRTDPEFDQVGELLINKRQSIMGSVEENLTRWKQEGTVILELTPRG